MQYQKAHSVAKEIVTRGPQLRATILKTLKICSDLVGSTLGPGGLSVVIEQQAELSEPIISKDGVTVYRNIGFSSPVMQSLMEAARDCSIRTGNSAGDGTTSATILAEAFVRYTMDYCDAHPKVSPQRVVRRLEAAFRDIIEPTVRKSARKVSLATPSGRKLLHAVAKISANGDVALADAVLECFELTGDKGNVTIMDETGPSGYKVERVDGYQISTGYEDSAGKFYQGFINDQARQMCVLEKPSYVLYHGKLTDVYDAVQLFERIDTARNANEISSNVVFVATGFSETVLANFAANFGVPGTIKVYPQIAPMNQMQSGQYDFLADLSALTGGVIFDPLNRPLPQAQVDELGQTPSFEAGRFRATALGFRDELAVLERVDTLTKQIAGGGLAKLDQMIVQERLGKLSGGVAKLKVIGSSVGELREKKDRADDAVCAVRGAIEHGALPAGGWMLMKLQEVVAATGDEILNAVLVPAFQEPINRLYTNAGYQLDEVAALTAPMRDSKNTVYDILEGTHVDAFKKGVLDSVPAVLEAIRNSLSIAALLGTCGGCVVFARDRAIDLEEAKDSHNFMNAADLSGNSAGFVNEANERG